MGEQAHTPEHIPAQVAVFVEALGEDGAVDFLLTFGGAELSIPRSPGKRSKLVDALGSRKAATLCSFADRIPRRIPTAKPWIASQMRSKGLPVAEIARRLHATDVSVRAWLKTDGKSGRLDPRQGSLF